MSPAPARLPAATAYREALQDPASCFADPDLAAGSVALTPLGLPRAVSGNVAAVFRVDGAGGRSWAVRCFVRPVSDEERRYAGIAAHLAGTSSPWQVGVECQPRGILVDGRWWPLVKMAWAPGEPLLAYVERHLWDGPALAYLAVRVAELAERLRADGVAHGDLQHANILVSPGGDLRLVDYDGMYVPALAGLPGTERGHRNYQHPGRGTADFGAHLDHFSTWVLYASLCALAADPLLWGRLDGGDECLLFRHLDLVDPGRSPALAALEARGGGLAELAGSLRGFLARPPLAVPPLSLAHAPPPEPAVGTSVAGAAETAERRRLFDALRAASPPAAPPAVPPLPAAGGRAGPRALAAALRRLRHRPKGRAAHAAGGGRDGPHRAAADAHAAVEDLGREAGVAGPPPAAT